jgi:transcription elongation factor Elf1
MNPAEACRVKQHFPTRARAEEARRRLARDEQVLVSVYGCPACGKFHLTSRVPNKKKRRTY